MIFAIFSCLAAILGFPALVGGACARTRAHTHTHKGPSEHNLSCFLLYGVCKFGMWEVCRTYIQHVESIGVFQRSTHLFWQPFCTFKEQQYSLLAEMSSPLLAVTGTWSTAMPHNWCNVILTGFFAKDQADDNLMVLGQVCRVDMAGCTLHSKFVDRLCSVHARVWPNVVWRGNTWDIFLVGQTWQRQAFRLSLVSV
jgi:hypothetical protein